jgi:dihydrodipicolinate synthase/N-acetylneuraminate lyase
MPEKGHTVDLTTARTNLQGCYVTLPTMFRDDDDLSVDYSAIRRHARFLLDRGLVRGRAVMLTGGAAGDFSTMSMEERIRVLAEVIDEVQGRVPVVLGAQTASTRELVQLARAAEELGADYIQISPPYYFPHTDGDLFEHVRAASDAADVGIIVYNTYWTSSGLTIDSLDRLLGLPKVVGLKWSAPDTGFMEFEQVLTRYADAVSIIDNQMRFVTSHMLGARAIEVHICNHWPEWGLRMVDLLEQRRWEEAQQELVRVGMPFMQLWAEMEEYTSGDGYLDKLCMELVGLGSSRCRPPTRDVRDMYRHRARQMLRQTGTPGVIDLDDVTAEPVTAE